MAFGKCKSKLVFDSSKSENKSIQSGNYVSNSFILPSKINTAKWDTALALFSRVTIIVLECIYVIDDVNSFGMGLNTRTFKIEIQFNATRGLCMTSVVFCVFVG